MNNAKLDQNDVQLGGGRPSVSGVRSIDRERLEVASASLRRNDWKWGACGPTAFGVRYGRAERREVGGLPTACFLAPSFRKRTFAGAAVAGCFAPNIGRLGHTWVIRAAVVRFVLDGIRGNDHARITRSAVRTPALNASAKASDPPESLGHRPRRRVIAMTMVMQ